MRPLPTIDHSLLSPSGRVSKRAREAATKRGGGRVARIRTIKPEFWTDDKVVQVSFPARLLFIGLWNFADDSGNLENSPVQIKMRILPAHSVSGPTPLH